MPNDIGWQIAKLEEELADLRRQVEAADKVSAERRRNAISRALVPGGSVDVMPLRDRIQVLKQKIVRLKKRSC